MIKVSLVSIYFCAFHLVWIQKLKQPVITMKVMTENQPYCGFQRWEQAAKWWPTENRVHTLLLVELLGKEISFGFVISTLLMTRQSLKVRKFMTDQMANAFSYVWWPSVISTPDGWKKCWNNLLYAHFWTLMLIKNTRTCLEVKLLNVPICNRHLERVLQFCKFYI